MVRKACRTYSAIENEFKKLDAKDAKLRTFFQPLNPKELQQLHEEARSSSQKHRYAESLQWADDISMIMAADDPVLVDRLRRSHARAASAHTSRRNISTVMASGKNGVVGSKTANGGRPNSAPVRPLAVETGGSALQAALQGAIESASRPSSSGPPRRGFESSLLDEYLRSKSLQPLKDVEREASKEPGLDDLPLAHIEEGVEEIDEDDGMDGEDSMLSSGARLMYYGHTQPRHHSAGSTSPRSPRSRSPGGGIRTSSPRVQRPYSGIPKASLSSSPLQRPSSAASMVHDTHNGYRYRPQSAATHSCEGGYQRLPASSRPLSATVSHPPRPWSGNPSSSVQGQTNKQRPSSARTEIEHRAGQEATIPYTSNGLEHSGTTQRFGSVAMGSKRNETHAQPCHSEGANVMPNSALQSRVRSSTQQSSYLCLESKPSSRHGPSNGIMIRDPAGPAVATHRAQRPTSATLSSSGRSLRGAGLNNRERPMSAQAAGCRLQKVSPDQEIGSRQQERTLTTASLDDGLTGNGVEKGDDGRTSTLNKDHERDGTHLLNNPIPSGMTLPSTSRDKVSDDTASQVNQAVLASARATRRSLALEAARSASLRIIDDLGKSSQASVY